MKEELGHVVFLACNYGNKKIKNHFNSLKEEIEDEYPLKVILIDKERGRGAPDIWAEIKDAIEMSSLAIFDVTGNRPRPNVVLELGYALAIKDTNKILITSDDRKPRNKENEETWLLSDIGHLKRVQYKTLKTLDKQIWDHIEKIPAVKRYWRFDELAKTASSAHEKYTDVGFQVLLSLRDGKRLGDAGVAEFGKGTGIRKERLFQLFRDSRVAKRGPGPHGRWKLGGL